MLENKIDENETMVKNTEAKLLEVIEKKDEEIKQTKLKNE